MLICEFALINFPSLQEENEEEPESDSENLDISCPVDPVPQDPGYQYRCKFYSR